VLASGLVEVLVIVRATRGIKECDGRVAVSYVCLARTRG
jgi:hypothetical protein